MTTFLMVAGAWQGGGVWTLVAERLRADGHSVLTPDLPGLGEDTTPAAEVTRRGWAQFLAERLDEVGSPVVLVGHSRGGMTVSDAAKLRPALVSALIYVAALPPTPEWPLKRLARYLAEHGSGLKPRMTEARDAFFNTPEEVRPIYFNRTPDELADRTIAALRPEPAGAVMADAELDAATLDGVRKAYIECLHDRSLSIEVQRHMQTLQDYAVVETLDADHSAFVSAPLDLADAIERVAAKLAPVA